MDASVTTGMMSAFPKSTVLTMKFIRLVERYPLLHRRHLLRDAELIWDKLEIDMGILKKVLISKWRRLRDAYRRELRSELALPAGRYYVTNWPYWEQMRFMREVTLQSLQDDRCKPRTIAVNQRANQKKKKPPATAVKSSSPCDTEEPAVASENCLRPPELSDVCTEPYAVGMEESDFLMTRIHPYLVAMPAARKVQLCEKMQQLVFREYQLCTKQVAAAAAANGPSDWMGASFDDQ